MYEQLIEKPKMTQKLLCKPPFRYIHDIYTATLAVTGYGNGLFSEAELDGKAITEKDAKINWLVKLLQLTELVIGEEIDCKPTKIVAGHEPEKTNFFLQQMFQAATAGIDTTPHVMQILGIGQEEGDEQDEQALAEAEAAA
jgi:TRAF3-interacting protein 1